MPTPEGEKVGGERSRGGSLSSLPEGQGSEKLSLGLLGPPSVDLSEEVGMPPIGGTVFELGSGRERLSPEIEKYSVVNAVREPNEHVLDLLRVVGLVKGEHDLKLESVNEILQREFFPKDEQGRPIEPSKLDDVEEKYGEYREQLDPIFKELGMRKDIEPVKSKYDYAVVLGTVGPDAAIRINYLISLIKERREFGKIVFLTGKRDLEEDQKIDGVSMETEIDLLKYLWRKKKVELFEDLGNLNVDWVDAPKRPNPKNPDKPRRPTTISTYEAWKATRPSSGDALYISNGPSLGRQHESAKKFAPLGIVPETVGLATKPEKNYVASYLREVASWIREIHDQRYIRGYIPQKDKS